MGTRQVLANAMLASPVDRRLSYRQPFNNSASRTLQILPGHPSRTSQSCRVPAASAAAQTLDDVKPAFDRCTTEAEFLKVLKSALSHPKAPDFLYPAFHDFYNNYKGAAPTRVTDSRPL